MGSGSRYVRLVVILGVAFIVTNYIGIGCSKPGANNTPAVPAPSSVPEAGYCTSVQTYSAGLTVTGSAAFNIRASSSAGLGAEVAGGSIRFAEVQVLDESGNVVQCGETDTNGNFSLVVPKGHTLKLNVNSRSQNSHVNASVLNNPTSNQYYSLSTSFSSNTGNASLNVGTLTASATGDILGGAFNILFNLLRANESLRYYVCGGINTSCTGFSVAPKVQTYWAKGVNPYVYFGGDPTSGLSFYVPGSDKLYILGGINGDVNSSDTDHFDDSVISHEYGHFIEDHYAKTDSPGGSHDASHILDARLMWGEGWADFFSSAVRGSKIYRDTYGNIDGGANSTGCFFNYDIDANSNGGFQLDVPGSTGEGNFREFTITRAFWDAIDPTPLPGASAPGANGGATDDNTNDTLTQPFLNFWNVFHGNAFPGSSEHFRAVGRFLELENNSTLNSSAVLSFQKINPNRKDYALPLPTKINTNCPASPSPTPTPIPITANDPSQCNMGGQVVCNRGQLDACCSNQMASNDFYDVNYDGSFSTISLTHVSGPAQIDLYLYQDGYTFGSQSDIVRSDIQANSSNRSINLSGLAAGHYLLNVNVYTGNGNPAASSYQLFVNGTQVCP